jgi:cation diffusion facilitator family transporter
MKRDAKAIRRVIWTTLVLNLLVAMGKLAYGLHAGILAMVADGVHSSLDAGNNVIGLIAVAAAHRPPDDDHPYGHRKFETVAALGIGALLVLACWEILKAGWAHLFQPPAVGTAGTIGYVVMVVTLVVNTGVSMYEKRAGQRLGSEFLIADATHTRSDIMTSFAVIVALAARSMGWPFVDVIVTFFIVLWIGYLAWQVMKPALATLADEARIDPQAVDQIAMSVFGVHDVHRIRTRGAPDAVFIDLHVQVHPHATVEEAHRISHQVETLLRERFPQVEDVVVHVEPHGDPVEGLDGAIVGPPRG